MLFLGFGAFVSHVYFLGCLFTGHLELGDCGFRITSSVAHSSCYSSSSSSILASIAKARWTFPLHNNDLVRRMLAQLRIVSVYYLRHFHKLWNKELLYKSYSSFTGVAPSKFRSVLSWLTFPGDLGASKKRASRNSAPCQLACVSYVFRLDDANPTLP